MAVVALGAPMTVYSLSDPAISLQGTVTVPGVAPISLWPARYRWDFGAPGDHWLSGSISNQQQVEGGIFRSVGPWMEDDNHLLAGLVNHIIFRNAAGWAGPDPIVNPCVFTNAIMAMRFRGVNYNPQGSHAMPWLQARFPGQDKWSNHGYKHINWNADLADGEWHERTIILEADELKWVAGGAPGATQDNGVYGIQPIATSLQNVHNFFPVMAVRPQGAAMQTGEVQVDWVEILHFVKIPPEVDDTPPPEPPSLVPVLPVMTGPTTDGVTITATGPAQYPGWQHANGLQWNGSAGALEVQLPAPIIPKRYQMRARLDDAQHAPRSYTFEGWNGSQWVALHSAGNVPGWGGGETRAYDVAGQTAYDRLRINVTASQSGSYLQWREWQIWA